jgi:AcrR family transcriptional regulator
MARTQAADYDQRREAIVDRAASLFASSGFRGTSVSDLAKACETSKSLLYHYYPSKEDVLYAVMSSHIDQLLEDVEEVMARDGSPAELLHALIHSFMAHYVGAADRQKVLLNELDSLPADRRAEIVGKQRTVIDAVQGLLVGIDARLSDPAQARVQTMLLFGMINWTHTWFDPAGPVSAAVVADLALDHFLPGGVKPQAS